MRQHQWIRTKIAEPFPVMYSHVSQTCRKANDPNTQGPFYAAGAEFFRLHNEKSLAHAQWSAEALRKEGYTVTVDVVTR